VERGVPFSAALADTIFATGAPKSDTSSKSKFVETSDRYPNSPWTYIGHFLAHLLSLAFLSLSHQSPDFRCLSLRRRQSAAVGALTVAKPFSKVARHSSWCSYLSLSF
jgi:hypothetical protein